MLSSRPGHMNRGPGTLHTGPWLAPDGPAHVEEERGRTEGPIPPRRRRRRAARFPGTWMTGRRGFPTCQGHVARQPKRGPNTSGGKMESGSQSTGPGIITPVRL